MNLISLASRGELAQSRSRLRLETSYIGPTNTPHKGVEVLEQLKIESEKAKDSIDRRTSSAVKAWAEEVNSALKKNCSVSSDDLGERLRILDEKGEQLEKDVRQNLLDSEDLDMRFDTFDTTCRNFDATSETNPTKFEVIKREGERLKKRHQEVMKETKRIARERLEFVREVGEVREEVTRFGENVPKLCMVNAVQDVASDESNLTIL